MEFRQYRALPGPGMAAHNIAPGALLNSYSIILVVLSQQLFCGQIRKIAHENAHAWAFTYSCAADDAHARACAWPDGYVNAHCVHACAKSCEQVEKLNCCDRVPCMIDYAKCSR